MRLSLPVRKRPLSGQSQEDLLERRRTGTPPLDTGFEIRVPLSKVLLGVLLTVIPICLLGLYSVSRADRLLEEAAGTHFAQVAQTVAGATAHFVHERVLDVAQIAADGVVVEAAARANQAYRGVSDTAIAARIGEIDRQWNTPAAAPVVQQMLASEASNRLRRHRDLDTRMLRITVTDEKGATIAATHKTLDYFQADEEYWQNIYAKGRGAISVTDILYDEATKSNYIGVGVPILEDRTNRFIGTVDALIDLSSLFPTVNQVSLGPTARTLLVKDDGTVISAPNAALSLKVKSSEFAAAEESVNAAIGQAGHMAADISGSGRTIIGFAGTGLKRDYGSLGWVVLVAQNASEALAPTRLVVRLLAFMSVLGLVMVSLLSVYFALHRTLPAAATGYLYTPVETPGLPEATSVPTKPDAAQKEI